MLGQHGKPQKQQLEPSAFPSFLHAHDVNPGRFARTTTTGQVSWSSIGSDYEVCAEEERGGARERLVGWVHRSPVRCPLSAPSAPGKVSPHSVCSKLLPTQLANRLLKFPGKIFLVGTKTRHFSQQNYLLQVHHQQVLPNIKTTLSTNCLGRWRIPEFEDRNNLEY